MDKTNRIKLKELLLLALKEEGADMGLIRRYEPDDDELIIVCHHGFSQEYLTHFYSVKPFDRSCCGRAFGINSTVPISDIEQDLSFAKQVKILKSLKTEFHAVKSVPIISPKGRKLGVFSCHYKEPKYDWHFNLHAKFLAEMAEQLTDRVSLFK